MVYYFSPMIFKATKEGIICAIKVVPNASKSALGEVLQINSGKEIKKFLKVYIKSPAVEGKANQELIKFLSEIWKFKKSQIKIIKGRSQSYKILLVEGDPEILLRNLS